MLILNVGRDSLKKFSMRKILGQEEAQDHSYFAVETKSRDF